MDADDPRPAEPTAHGSEPPTPPAATAEDPGDRPTPAYPSAVAEAVPTRVVGPPAELLEAKTRAVDVLEIPAEARSEDTGLRALDVLGSYQILKKLGGGGMAEVYLARSALGSGVEKLVALKTARPSYGPDTQLGALFLNEARVSASLEHPNVVQVFDFGEAAGRPYLAMEFVRGRELHDVLKAVNSGLPLPIDFLVGVLVEVCRALEYVHTKKALDGAPLGLVHRDVSPSNVLLTPQGGVKLMDFGVAAAEDDLGGLVVGKKAYMPDEQASGGRPDPTWDVYAVGAILREFLAVSRFGPPPTGGPVEVLPELEAIATRAISSDPKARYGSARELREALEALQPRLSPPNVGATIQVLFAGELAVEEQEIELLVQRGRARLRGGEAWSSFKRLRALRRRLAATRTAMWFSTHALARRAVIATTAVVVVGGAVLGIRALVARAAFEDRLAAADARITSGRLVGPGGDQAMDLLVAARAERPDDPRVRRRLAALADTFERLGDAALARQDHGEAAAHLQAALQAQPDRASAASKLAEVEAQVRERSRSRRRGDGP